MNITQERLPGFQALTYQPNALKVKA